MVYRRRFLSNPYIDFPPPTVAPAVVDVAEQVLPAVAEQVLPVIAEDPVVEVPDVVAAEAPKAPKRASKAKKTPVAE